MPVIVFLDKKENTISSSLLTPLISKTRVLAAKSVSPKSTPNLKSQLKSKNSFNKLSKSPKSNNKTSTTEYQKWCCQCLNTTQPKNNFSTPSVI